MKFNSRRRLERERDEQTSRADTAEADRDRLQAENDELRRKVDPPVKVRRVVSGGAVESNRRRH